MQGFASARRGLQSSALVVDGLLKGHPAKLAVQLQFTTGASKSAINRVSKGSNRRWMLDREVAHADVAMRPGSEGKKQQPKGSQGGESRREAEGAVWRERPALLQKVCKVKCMKLLHRSGQPRIVHFRAASAPGIREGALCNRGPRQRGE